MKLRVAKKVWISIFILLLLFLVPFLLMKPDVSFKKDSSAYNKPTNFKLKDYKTNNALNDAVHAIFPPGTERKYIEGILGQDLKHRWIKNDKVKGEILYIMKPPLIEYPGYSIWGMYVVYDQDDLVVSIRIKAVSYPFARPLWERAGIIKNM